MAMAKVEWHGSEELIRKFVQLPKAVQKKVQRPVMRRAAKLVQTAVKRRVPVGTGLLRKLIKVRSIKRSRVWVGAFCRTPTRKELGIPKESKWYYPAIVEYGHSKRSGLSARPYMRSGWDATKRQVRAKVQREMGRGIERVAKRLK